MTVSGTDVLRVRVTSTTRVNLIISTLRRTRFLIYETTSRHGMVSPCKWKETRIETETLCHHDS